ncbi:MAG: NAD(P)(+) transhydrogenase (Re/Si-specific) subunit alpha, partial [Psychrosphaera sp.]|nr:NAD(P)(+) transhydrogenase (Re/Si-specific) subunit alpha [Psychrosphaera sp.]
MQIGIPLESLDNECRVAASPTSIAALVKLGFSVVVQTNAGDKASFSDADYLQSGAMTGSEETTWQADLILKVNPPTMAEIDSLKSGATLISFLAPAQNEQLLSALAAKQCTAIAMESIPRISRAQSMDALSSMANIAGYRAVVEASHLFGRFFTGQITAAGKIPPAKVMIIGAGVAGLAAIG